MLPRDFTVSVVIPVYNEISTIETVLGRVSKAPLPEGAGREMIVVDDGSQDGSRERLRELAALDSRIKLFEHEGNMGKGAALRTGFSKAVGDVVIVQDADLEYDPRDYPVLLDPILRGEAEVVYGSRFLGGPHRVLFFWHSIGNRLLTMLSNMFTNLNLSDMETGYKVFKREVLEGIDLRSRSFTVEPELTAKMAKKKVRIYEVPISYHGRTYAEGKKIGWKDAVAAGWAIVRYNLFS